MSRPSPSESSLIDLDPEIAALLAEVAAPRVTAGSADVEELRADLRERRRRFPPDAPTLHEVREVDLPLSGRQLAGRLYRPVEDADFLTVYFHGGGWVIGDLDTADASARRLAAETGSDVLSVDYRLAPEHPFPAAVRDAEDAVEWAAANLAARRALAVAGESSGATLAAVCGWQRGRVPVAAQLLIYPVTDCDLTRPSYTSYELPHFTRAKMAWYWDQYLPDPAERVTAKASPVRALDVTGAAPAVVVLAGHDLLLDEGREYAQRLEDAGVPVRLLVYEGAVHGFLALPCRIGDRALTEACSAFAAAVHRQQGTAGTRGLDAIESRKMYDDHANTQETCGG